MMQTSTMLLPTFGFWMAASLRTQHMADQITFLQTWGAQSNGLRPLRPPLDFSCITRLTRLLATIFGMPIWHPTNEAERNPAWRFYYK
jgi:hypothetical protein